MPEPVDERYPLVKARWPSIWADLTEHDRLVDLQGLEEMLQRAADRRLT